MYILIMGGKSRVGNNSVPNCTGIFVHGEPKSNDTGVQPTGFLALSIPRITNSYPKH
jgi:hypothetical protein